jgi:hypothetical protein
MGSAWKKIALLSAAVLIVLFFAEISLRVFAPIHMVGQLDWYQYDDDLAIRLKPSMHALHLSDHQSEMKTNGLGTVNFQESFDGYEQVIFAAGDSYTEGVGLAADASYPFQLDILLNTRSGEYQKDFAVVNLGLAAYGADQAMIAIDRWAETISPPDYILYFGCSNDYGDDILFQRGYRHEHLVDGNPRYGIFVEPLQWLLDEVQVFKRAKFAIARIRDTIRVSQRPPDPQEEIERANDEHGLRNIARRQEAKFDLLAEMAERHGAALIVSWTDFPGRDNGSYEWLRDWAASNGARFADWHPSVSSVLSSIPALPIANPHSSGHYRTWINSLIARAYAAQVEDALAERASDQATAERGT